MATRINAMRPIINMTENATNYLGDLITQHEIRVAVCGMQNSGKTIFITSLADHLLHHDPERNVSDDRRFDLGSFVVGDDADVKDVHISGDSIGNFAFRDYRKSFANNEWPEKTAETSELVLDFTLENKNRTYKNPLGQSGSKRRAIRLRILDIPGERLADFIMAGRDFAEWSDAILGNGKYCRQHLDAYRNNIESAVGNSDAQLAESIILSEYRKTLDKAKESWDRFVSPSVYRLPLGGKSSLHLLGLENMEFAPMTATLRERFPDVTKKFSRNYRAYRDSVAKPIVDWMKTADKALFLLDVFSCLNLGSQAYNGAIAETNAALDILGSKGMLDGFKSSVKYLFTRFQFPISPHNMRIVVTKIDLADEQGRKNLLELAKQMFGKKAQAVTGFKASADAFLACAAVETDEDNCGGSGVKKRAYPGIPNEKKDACPGDGIPRAFPENLDAWKGRFPLKPINPAWFNLRNDLPPKHTGLDTVACFILDIPFPPPQK